MPRITDLTCAPLDLDLTEPFVIATGAQAALSNVVVRLRLEDGTEGWGEGAPMAAVDGATQQDVLSAVQEGARRWHGQEAGRWRLLCAELAAEGLCPPARAALEMALLDALARYHRLSLVRWWGGTSDHVLTDMTITAGDEAHAAACARAIWERGITTIKVKVGAGSPEEDAARMAVIHNAAPQARLVVDANGGWDLEQARRFLRSLQEQRIPLALFEQPVARGDEQALRALAQEQPVTICADESARSPQEVVRLASLGVPAVNLKTMKCGVVQTLQMAEVAQAHGMQLMIGGMVESRLSMAFSAHIAAGLGGFSFVDLDTPMFVARDPFNDGYSQSGERMTLDPNTPGHGVRWLQPPQLQA